MWQITNKVINIIVIAKILLTTFWNSKMVDVGTFFFEENIKIIENNFKG